MIISIKLNPAARTKALKNYELKIAPTILGDDLQLLFELEMNGQVVAAAVMTDNERLKLLACIS